MSKVAQIIQLKVKSMVQKLSKNQRIIFPEETLEAIEELLKKYDLYREPAIRMKELAEKIQVGRTFQEKRKISASQPERMLAKIIRGVAEGEIAPEKLYNQLQQAFNLSSAKAKSFANDLEKNVIILAQRVSIKEEAAPSVKRPLIKPLPVAPPPKESLETPSLAKPKVAPPEIEKPEVPLKEKKPEKPDTYREPVE